jgi:hypothetical protein
MSQWLSLFVVEWATEYRCSESWKNIPAGVLVVSFAAGSALAAGAVAGAGSAGLVGVGADASVLVGAGAEESAAVGCGCCFFFLLKRPRKPRFS